MDARRPLSTPQFQLLVAMLVGEAHLDPEQLVHTIDDPSVHTNTEPGHRQAASLTSPTSPSARTPESPFTRFRREQHFDTSIPDSSSAAVDGTPAAGYVRGVRQLPPDPAAVRVRDPEGLVEALRTLAVTHYVTVRGEQ